jgi:hypothetical protein
MSYPNVDSRPAASPAQTEVEAKVEGEVDEASRRRAIDALYRALTRLVKASAQDWRHCGKAACLRSRRCRGFACEPAACGDEASQV